MLPWNANIGRKKEGHPELYDKILSQNTTQKKKKIEGNQQMELH